jgi:hypothetical protein
MMQCSKESMMAGSGMSQLSQISTYNFNYKFFFPGWKETKKTRPSANSAFPSIKYQAIKTQNHDFHSSVRAAQRLNHRSIASCARAHTEDKLTANTKSDCWCVVSHCVRDTIAKSES